MAQNSMSSLGGSSHSVQLDSFLPVWSANGSAADWMISDGAMILVWFKCVLQWFMGWNLGSQRGSGRWWTFKM
jgi:hypothetical protein